MTFDPESWDSFREYAHRSIDIAINHLATIRQRPVWQAPPSRAASQIPLHGEALDSVLEEFERTILPYGGGNIHPGFMGWVQGAGTPIGLIAELMCATMNANCGGRHHAAIGVELEVTEWMRSFFSFPEGVRGIFTTGASQANFLAVLIARVHAIGVATRAHGYDAHTSGLTAYASKEVHGCVSRAMELAGVGSDFLRLIGTDEYYKIDLVELAETVERDRAAGLKPFLLIGNAGSVNTGSIDPLAALSQFAKSQSMYFHVDAALGAFAMADTDLAGRFEGIQHADSIAFDFHKWAHVPYDAGFLLSRSADLHDATFASEASYLSRASRGLAAGDWWPTDSGPDLSRGFRALKAWFTLKTYGFEAIGENIRYNCNCAMHLADRIAAEDSLALAAPVSLNIVCFGFIGENAAERNRRVVELLHEDGQFAPSLTFLNGHPVVRAAIMNHRTLKSDMDGFIDRLIMLDASYGQDEGSR